MNAKEKAKEIFNKMYQVDDIMGNYPMCFDTAKKCALIAVEDIISIGWNLPHYDNNTGVKYWEDVKSELQSLKGCV
jgi:hypothetical protein